MIFTNKEQNKKIKKNKTMDNKNKVNKLKIELINKNYKLEKNKNKKIPINEINLKQLMILIDSNPLSKSLKTSNSVSFINEVQNNFSSNWNIKNFNNNFNFFNLKIMLSKIIINQKILKNDYIKLTAFEKIFLKFFLKKISLQNDLIIQNIDNNNYKNQDITIYFDNNDNEKKLSYSLIELFKKLMFPFSDLKNNNFNSTFDLIKLNKNQKSLFYKFYFPNINLKNINDFKKYVLTENKLKSKKCLINYLKILKSSDKMKNEIYSYYDLQTFFNGNFYKRYIYEVCDKITKRINNYEIILNHFNILDEKNIIKWMIIILKDFELNSNVKIPLNKENVYNSISYFLKLFTLK